MRRGRLDQPTGAEAAIGEKKHSPYHQRMRFKALMLDVDGVVIVHPDPRGWSAHLERDLDLSSELLHAAFFQPHWQDIILGRADLRARLEPVLAEIAPHLSAETLTRYWFENDAHLNHGLLAQLDPIRSAGVKLHLATVQEHQRARHIWHGLELKRSFDDMHYAAELGCAKPDERFFRVVEAKSGFSPSDIFFIDDKQANVDAAHARGWSAALWNGTRSVTALMEQAADCGPATPSPPP